MTQFKRYMVFEIIEYYPSGGLYDCVAHSDDLDEAKNFACSLPGWDQSAEIFDRVQGTEINMVEGPALVEPEEWRPQPRELPTTLGRAAMATKDLYFDVRFEKS